jgi:glycerate dehydrogenase
MNIVITDGFTLNPGDLSWDFLNKYGSISLFDRTAPDLDLYVDRCKNADVIIVNKAGLIFNEELFAKLPKLKFILVAATGHNIIDSKAARNRNILVANVPGYGTASVAQHTIALILEIANRVGANSLSVDNGGWVKAVDWCYSTHSIVELAGKTLGIIGFGDIGEKVGKIANALGMSVLYYSRKDRKSQFGIYSNVDTILKKSDFISLHCPANENTMQMVNKDFLQKMKKSCYLINTSRGQLIDEKALAEALNSEIIAGAALDVLGQEPPNANNPLLKAKNCIITPHNAWISFEARQRIMAILEENLKAFLSDKPINVVN